MLSIPLLLATALQASGTPPTGSLPPMPAAPEATARMPVLGDADVGCRSDVRQASDVTVGNGLMWRDDGEPVGLYRLLDRRVNGCPDPVVVNYRVPGSNALGREAGRDPEPARAVTPDPRTPPASAP